MKLVHTSALCRSNQTVKCEVAGDSFGYELKIVEIFNLKTTIKAVAEIVFEMIRIFWKNLRNIIDSGKLYPSKTSTSILKKFAFTEILNNAKKVENRSFDELKQCRQAEVR